MQPEAQNAAEAGLSISEQLKSLRQSDSSGPPLALLAGTIVGVVAIIVVLVSTNDPEMNRIARAEREALLRSAQFPRDGHATDGAIGCPDASTMTRIVELAAADDTMAFDRFLRRTSCVAIEGDVTIEEWRGHYLRVRQQGAAVSLWTPASSVR